MMTESAIGLFSTRFSSLRGGKRREESRLIRNDKSRLFRGDKQKWISQKEYGGLALKAVGQAENVTARKRAWSFRREDVPIH